MDKEMSRFKRAMYRLVILLSIIPTIIFFIWASAFVLLTFIIVMPFTIITSILDIFWVIFQWITGVEHIETRKKWNDEIYFEYMMVGKACSNVWKINEKFAEYICNLVMRMF
jgi:hypothetical protein